MFNWIKFLSVALLSVSFYQGKILGDEGSSDFLSQNSDMNFEGELSPQQGRQGRVPSLTESRMIENRNLDAANQRIEIKRNTRTPPKVQPDYMRRMGNYPLDLGGEGRSGGDRNATGTEQYWQTGR